MKQLKRILFVDDEPLVLDGLRRMLRPMRHEWEMHFVGSGSAALETLDKMPFDVIVSDMRMPGMNGAELLNEVMRRHPRTVRLVLSGHADQELILQCVNATHQFLAKPCEPEVLRATIDRTCLIENRSNHDSVLQITSRLERLPSVPSLYDELVGKMRNPETSIEEVAGVVSRDPAMSAKVLKLVNSAFFGLRRRVVDLVEAVNFIGLDTLRSLALSVHAFGQFERGDQVAVPVEGLWEHCLRTALAARAIANAEVPESPAVGEAFVAGLLHDVGRLVLSENFPDAYREVVLLATKQGVPLQDAEKRVLGMEHAEVGAVLFSLWGLPDVIVDTTRWHHKPAAAGMHGFQPLTCVHLADCWLGFSAGPEIESPSYPDRAYLEHNQFNERVAVWKAAYDASITAAAAA